MSVTRRQFVGTGIWCAAAAAIEGGVPWYRRAYRWGQTNITEKDPARYDIAWWREHWKQTRVQAVIVNAGGIVAYYPSKFPLHRRAEFLNGRDLFGELTTAAHDDGLFVMARMDSNRTAEDFYQAHPDWFARDREGEPYRAADKYVTCINSTYYEEYLPGVLREIIERSRPEGVTDNSWAGLGRESICYCANCERRFAAKTGAALPRKADWNDRVYRQWIGWSYERRLEIWDLNNRTTQAAGGRDCIWSGMVSGSVSGMARSFRDLREICRRAPIVMLDHQRRDDDTGFQQNGDTGKRVHELGGWDKLAPESMAMYLSRPGYFRLASQTPAEARMWMIEGLAGGIQPWWHYVGAYQEDRRMFRTAEPVMRWAAENERYLANREPVATVGVVWSQRNADFFGRDAAAERVDAPYSGMMHALVRARIPYLPVHADDIGRRDFRLLILPNVGAMSEAQCDAVRRFVERGGAVLATGETSRYDEWGDARPDFGLADVLGVHGSAGGAAAGAAHTYLRLAGEAARHAVLEGFEETDIVPYGGGLGPLRVDAGAVVPLTFVPPFPTYPPETAWMREPATDVPGLVLRERGRSRVAYLAADLDRRYFLSHLPDHGRLLANVVRWCLRGELPVYVEGPGLIDVHVYRQGSRVIVHLVNLTSAGTWRAPVEELVPVGPVRVRVPGARGRARLLVSGGEVTGGEFVVERVVDHEVVAVG